MLISPIAPAIPRNQAVVNRFATLVVGQFPIRPGHTARESRLLAMAIRGETTRPRTRIRHVHRNLPVAELTVQGVT